MLRSMTKTFMAEKYRRWKFYMFLGCVMLAVVYVCFEIEHGQLTSNHTNDFNSVTFKLNISAPSGKRFGGIGERLHTVKDAVSRFLSKSIFSNVSHKQPNENIATVKRERRCFQLNWNKISLFVKNVTEKKCNFITNHNLIGRTGNQMFQIASIIGLAYKYDLIPLIKNVEPISKTFNLPNTLPINLTSAETVQTGACCIYHKQVEKISPDKNWTVTGYLQSFKYFKDAYDFVQLAFSRINPKYYHDVKAFLETINKTDTKNVCIHIRRGDFNTDHALNLGYSVADMNFIKIAIAFYRKIFHNVQFIVLSDEIDWCRRNVGKEDAVINFSPFTEAGKDLVLMSKCDHVVVTSGSFGWWGAWLSGGTNLYYTGYPVAGTAIGRQFNLLDYFPSYWIGLP